MLKVIFAGTPDFAAVQLQALLDTANHVCCVLTQPDRPVGRGRQLTPSPVKKLALAHAIPVLTPTRLNEEDVLSQLSAYAADMMLVVAYGQLVPPSVLSLPRLGCVNIHASLLPRWRGASPIQHAILAGDQQTGISIMQMDAGLDTGPVLWQKTIPLAADETGATLHDKLAALAAAALPDALTHLAAEDWTAVPQATQGITLAAKISKAAAAIDWQLSAQALARAVRAYQPWPVAFSQLGGQVVRIWQAIAQDVSLEPSAKPGVILAANREGIDVATGQGILRLLQLQLPGKRVLPVAELLNAQRTRFTPGECFL